MVSQSLVRAVQTLVEQLAQQNQITVSRAALVPAYEGAVPGLFTLIACMRNTQSCEDKIDCVIKGIHRYVSIEDRRQIASIRVFDTEPEFDYYISTGYGFDSCEPCMQYMQPVRQDLRPVPITV